MSEALRLELCHATLPRASGINKETKAQDSQMNGGGGGRSSVPPLLVLFLLLLVLFVNTASLIVGKTPLRFHFQKDLQFSLRYLCIVVMKFPTE